MQIIAKFPKKKKWTFQDLQNIQYFPYDVRIKIELIKHRIYVGIDTKIRHQEILSNTLTDIGSFVKKYKLGKTYFTPTAIKIDDGTILKPDILFISVSKYNSIKEDCIETAPELVIEVLSRANYKKLREAKKQLYADFGVQEYWEINTTKRKIKIETLDDTTKEYTTFSEARKKGTIKSKVLEGLEIDIENIFE
jgi:Uma2 family endonuclease